MYKAGMNSELHIGLDPRVGILNRNGKIVYYAFVDKSPVEGTLDNVMRALRGQAPRKARVPTMKSYVVTATVKYPAWDEKEGWSGEVMAYNAKEACKLFREKMFYVVDRFNGALKVAAKKK